MTSGLVTLGWLEVAWVPRPDWLSPHLPDPYLEFSTCHGSISPSIFPLAPLPAPSERPQSSWYELGVSHLDFSTVQEELVDTNLRFSSLTPTGSLIGYQVLGYDNYLQGWHSQHCHDMTFALNSNLRLAEGGLIADEADALALATWMNTEESGTEPIVWLPVSIFRPLGATQHA